MKKTLGSAIRDLRKQANLSLRDLAFKIEIDFTYLSKIENDKTDNRPPSEDIIKKIAKTLKGSESELLSLAKRIPDDLKLKLTSSKSTLDFFRNMNTKEIEKFIEDYKKKNT